MHKKIFSKKPEKVVKVSKPRKPKEIKVPEVAKTTSVDTSAKDAATSKGDPYVAILSVDVDPQNIHNGSFELDWNDKFLLNLIKAGYKMQDDDTDTM